ncbi:MAG: thioredoxin domain-containing protein [Ignavibacteria bacterium]|nr:thioredoxin domain-containing protein [Ignavibacteria bacterium]
MPEDGGPEYNRLIFTSSPYLLQHARNPVDWYPWCEAAFEKARREDKPIFLSIGYSTCHWCHVMEHESFEDPEVAAFLNEHYVSIKVDREERPDVDHIYMAVCQAMTGAGGWPLSVFMSPEQLPFFSGTYFPKTDRFGKPGFLRVLSALHAAWRDERTKVMTIGEELRGSLHRASEKRPAELDASVLDTAERAFDHSFDSVHGGFGGAPKFPVPHALSFLLRRHDRSGDASLLRMAEHTLASMYRGGVYDHVGFGFCRYSTDAQWLVPHFEKMLYDNALLMTAYTDAFLVTRKEEYATVVREIATYILRDMTSADGAFFSAENADSEGEEGKFYVFTRAGFLRIVGAEHGEALAEYFGITAEGNFEHGNNVLHIAVDPAEWRRRHGLSEGDAALLLNDTRSRLLDARALRVRPSLDDKILVSWNGLMISALSRAGVALDEPHYVQAARLAADFLLNTMLRNDGSLQHRHRAGETGIDGFLEDYAFFVWGLIDLYEATFEAAYLRQALALNARMIADFHDAERGGFFFTAHDAETLISRTKDVYDGALPSGNSSAALNLIRLARLTGDAELERLADATFRAMGQQVSSLPSGHTVMLTALDFAIGPSREIVLAAETLEDIAGFRTVLRSRFLPRAVTLFHASGQQGEALRDLVPFLSTQRAIEGRATAYLCENHVCTAPVTSAVELSTLLDGSR